VATHRKNNYAIKFNFIVFGGAEGRSPSCFIQIKKKLHKHYLYELSIFKHGNLKKN